MAAHCLNEQIFIQRYKLNNINLYGYTNQYIQCLRMHSDPFNYYRVGENQIELIGNLIGTNNGFFKATGRIGSAGPFQPPLHLNVVKMFQEVCVVPVRIIQPFTRFINDSLCN